MGTFDFVLVLVAQAAVLVAGLMLNRMRFRLSEVARIAAAAVVFGVVFDYV